MTVQSSEICPGCGLEKARRDGERHAYLGASASCWEVFGQVLAREYADPEYMVVHRLTVDAYAAQHPGECEARTIQSINVHLMGLYLSLERRSEAAYVRRVTASLTAGKHTLTWLERPTSLGVITVDDVVAARSPAAHKVIVETWARSVWQAWAGYRSLIVDLEAAIG